MTTLPNAKHERFAQALADGKTQIEAHEIAGYRPHRGNASSLAQDKNIVERLSAILTERERIRAKGIARSVEQTGYDLTAAMREADRALDLAFAVENPAAAASLITLRSKLHGLLIDRKEIRTGLLDDKSDDELDGIISSAAAEAEVSLGAAGEGSETKH